MVRRLMSQGMTRPGTVQEPVQHWISTVSEPPGATYREVIDALTRAMQTVHDARMSINDDRLTKPVPARRPNKRLSNPHLR